MSQTSSSLVPAPDKVLQRLEWTVIRRLDGLFQGDYRTLFYGMGIDFADLREYQPRDDIRHIDWNVTARMNSPYVRQFVEDRDITAWFLIDLTRSMTFGAPERSKEAVLIDFVATLARLLTRGGNSIGAIFYNNGKTRTIPPRTGKPQVLRLIREIQQGATLRQDAHGGATQLEALMHAGLNVVKRRSVVFVLSDFISEPGWNRPLTMLNRRHELIAVRLWDPYEIRLPDAGLLVVEDAETGEHLYVDTGDAGFRRRFAQAAEERLARLHEESRRSGVELYSLSTQQDITQAIVKMASLRKRRRQ